jgi:DinB superfamily/Pentapeptide repeats (8 copies)
MVWLTAAVGEEFEDRDLSDSVFWGVDLRKSLFRDADLSHSRFFHVSMSEVSVDGVIDRLVVNGVDVTNFVNTNDRWYPLRNELSPADEVGVRSTWSRLMAEWEKLYAHVDDLSESVLMQSVNGEWSFRDTLRHMLFVHDKWFNWPLGNQRTFSPIGLPNTGSQGGAWPGLDLASNPTYAETLIERRAQTQSFSKFVDNLNLAELPDTSAVLENGDMPTIMCVHAILEEEFEHLRYAWRDIERADL